MGKLKKIKKSIMKGAPGMRGMTPAIGSADFGLDNPKFIGDLSRYTAKQMVKRGLTKAVEIARLKEEIVLTRPVGPPQELEQPPKPDEIRLIAQRLYDLGYYYQDIPETGEIEFTLAPTYVGLVGQATHSEQDSLQAAIKRFQLVHGTLPVKCNGYIYPEDDTLKMINSPQRTAMVSYNTISATGINPIFEFKSVLAGKVVKGLPGAIMDAEKCHNHLHSRLWQFMDVLKWFYNKMGESWRHGRGGKGLSTFDSVTYSNLPTNIVVSSTSRGYPGDGHRNIDSMHYMGMALDIVQINGMKVAEAPREITPPASMKIPPQVQSYFTESMKNFVAMMVSPVSFLAFTLDEFKESGNQLPVKWRITELDTPWHGQTQTHQEYIHVAVNRKL